MGCEVSQRAERFQMPTLLGGWAVCILGWTTAPGPHVPHLPHAHAAVPRAGPVTAKFIGAALAAAFAEKNDKNKTAVAARAAETLEQKEERVVETIRAVIDAGAAVKPRKTFSALGDFGQASGSLAQTWLTPNAVERVVSFWGCGSTVLARDIRRFDIFSEHNARAAPWFLLLVLNTFPWTPLLIPLVGRAVNSTDRSDFVPPAFSDERLAAMRRLRRDTGLMEATNRDLRTPQNIDEGIAFFSDGWKIFLRDLRRNRLLSNGDTIAAYAWFSLLAVSTFPLTPLILPVIDKRRPDGVQGDYVPSSFRGRRLAAYARLASSRRDVDDLETEQTDDEERPSPWWRAWERVKMPDGFK